MPRRPPASRRWLTAATWPVGVALTSWDYMWRTTPMHRHEALVQDPSEHLPPPLTDGVDRTEVLGPERGHGPLFHRRYRTSIGEAQMGPEELIGLIRSDPNRAAPTKFARFQKVFGEKGSLEVGDEFVVRMPGPWDGPVRVVAVDQRSFRLATLEGHLEAGQIEFRADDSDPMRFEIESWARSADRLADLLYHRVRMAKEVQLHMWISFLEGAVALAGGRMTGGVEIETRRVEDPFGR
jgi:uncharacterized protein DUF1990